MRFKYCSRICIQLMFTPQFALENWQFQIFKRHYVYFVGESKVRTNYNYMYRKIQIICMIIVIIEQ
jgi:hypothetical protein